MSKSHSLDHILGLPEEEIAERYPHGITLQPDKRWIAAEHDLHGMGHRTLGDLIADKRRRIKPDRYLGRQAGYVETKEEPYRAMFGEAAAIDEETQERYSGEARERYARDHMERLARTELRSNMSRLRQLAIRQIKAGNDPGPAIRQWLDEQEARELKDDEKAA